MARKTRLTPYGGSIVEAIDLNESGSEFRPYRSNPSMAAKGCFLPDDPIPLFLSSPAEEPKPPELAKARYKAVISPRILKAGILAAAAAAIVFAVLSVENPLPLFANAKASLIGISARQPATPMKSAAEPIAVGLTGAGPSTPIVQSSADVAALPPAAPTREEIAAAFKAAHQSQPEIRQPPVAAPPARLIDAAELAALLKRAKSLIAIGDIAAARLLLERAADAQEAGAALLLAQTYDPAVLGTPDARSITPDPAMARGWYRKAAQLGSPDAQQRLAQMQN
jgi:hypothetical protein